MSLPNIDFSAVRRHFEARVSHTAGLIQAPGVLVTAGTMRPQQQTFVRNAVWDAGTLRGSNGTQAAHIIAGGLYVVHRSGDPRFTSLLRQGYVEDRNGYVVTPMFESALSVQGRQLIATQMTATTVLPATVNRIDLAAEGTRGNQPPSTAGEKTALEHAVSFVKGTAPGRPVAYISALAIEQTKQLCASVFRRLVARDAELRSKSEGASNTEREVIQQQRELIDLKVKVVAKPDLSLDIGLLGQEAALLYHYEKQAQSDAQAETERTAASRFKVFLDANLSD